MPRKLPPFDRDDAIRRYVAGEPLEALQERTGLSRDQLRGVMKQACVLRRAYSRNPKLPAEREPELVASFDAGTSVLALARRFDLSRSVVLRILASHGRAPRSGGDANRLRFARMGEDELAALTEAAHRAARGRTPTREERCKAAQTREARRTHVSPAEDLIACWLRERGIDSIPQKAIGPYNADLGAGPIAVEVFGGGWHAYGGHLARTPERYRYILDQGWVVLIVWVDRKRYPLGPKVADYLVSLIERAGRDPAMRGKYWVIRGNGQEFAAGETDVEQITVIPTDR